jgi:tripartite-type tricarboxylate transporter receptor subunit TctC
MEDAMLRRMILRWAFAAVLGMASFGALAAYPERPVTLIVPFAPGGANDIAARIISDALGEALGQPVVIENRGGAGGNIGITAAARARPDGYTLLIAPNNFVVNPSLYKKVAFDPIKDFAPVADLTYFVVAVTVRADSDIDSLATLIARAKEKPFSFSSPGVGTTPHLVGELIKQHAHIEMVHVSYPSAGQAAQAALSGTVQVANMSLSVALPQIQGGTLRGLAVTGRERWAELPNVPTLAEAGIPTAISESWQGIVVPAGTPPEVIDRLAKELTAIVQRPEIRARLRQAGFGVTGGGPEALRQRIADEIPRWKAVIEKAGIKFD